LDVDGTWTGGDPSVSDIYTIDNDATFNFNDSTPCFVIFADGSNDREYSIDRTAINILWDGNTSEFRYSAYPTIGDIKNIINSTVPGIDATGDVSLDSSNSESFKIASGTINPDATIYPALRPCHVEWYSISDKMLNDRLSFATDRSDYLKYRNDYLENERDLQIRNGVWDDKILNDGVGNPSDLYKWANNRWNRRQGCNAKLKQIEKQIEANQSALEINQMMSQ
jgi:hypothetical protein